MSSALHTVASRWALPIVLLALILPLYIGLLPWAFDDAYIHLRVADNLATGAGPYYNPGQVVNASSAPAWTLLLALLKLLGGSVFWVACLNAVLTVVGAGLFVDLIGRFAGTAADALLSWSAALAYCGAVHCSGAGLMEIPAALLVLGLALRAWCSGSPWSFALFSSACFFRFELAVFLILFLAEASVSGRCDRTRAWLAALLGGLPFVVYLLLAFGTVVPQTATAKARVYALTFADSWKLLVDFGVPGGSAVLRTVLRWAGLPAGAILLVTAWARSRGPGAGRAALPVWPLGVGALSIVVAYVATRTLVFPWYAPLAVAPGLLFLVAVVHRSGLRWARIAVVGIGLAPFALELVPSAVAAFADRPYEYRYFAVNARVRKYREIGARLDAAYPGARLLSSEVGGLGDGFHGEVLDAAGLITPGALEHHPMEVPRQRSSGLLGSIPAAWVAQTEPELIVSMDVFAEELLRSDVAQRYRRYREPIYVDADLAAGAPPILWGSASIQIFVRKDLPGLRP